MLIKAQDTSAVEGNPAPIIVSPSVPNKVFTKKEPNILDSFKTDSLRKFLIAPFELPISYQQVPLDGSYEKLEYDAIVKYDKLKPKKTWFLISFLSVLLLFMILKLSYLKQVIGLIKALFNKTYFREHLDNLQTEINTYNFLQVLLKSAVFAQVLYLCLSPEFKFLSASSSDGLNFVVLLGIIFAYFSLERILRHLFSNLTLITEFNKNVFLLQSSVDLLFVLILFPALVFFYYQDVNFLSLAQLQNLGLIIICVFFVTRTVVSLLANKEIRTVYKFLIITYLCTFEIFPFLIWVKILRI